MARRCCSSAAKCSRCRWSAIIQSKARSISFSTALVIRRRFILTFEMSWSRFLMGTGLKAGKRTLAPQGVGFVAENSSLRLLICPKINAPIRCYFVTCCSFKLIGNRPALYCFFSWQNHAQRCCSWQYWQVWCPWVKTFPQWRWFPFNWWFKRPKTKWYKCRKRRCFWG